MLAWGEKTHVMGVLNLTPDSFSDGGRFLKLADACREARRQLIQGASVLDLGAQSTRPGARDVGADLEADRLLPALRAIRFEHPEAVISVDTFHASVAEKALAAGADWINDVSWGDRDPALQPLVAEHGCPYVLMHHRGTSQTMDAMACYSDVGREVRESLLRATDTALAAGVRSSQLIWDPGLGFAKGTEQNLALLRQLPVLKAEGFPLLVGPSRKRFIGEVLGEPRPRARLWGTAAVVCQAISAGADVVRVHDVGPIAETVRMADALWRASLGAD